MEETINKLKKIKAKKVFLQFPEGIKLRVQEIAKELEKNGFTVITCIEPCYGACDVRDEEAIKLGCDSILHIGHEPFIHDTKLPVVYWEYFLDVDPLPALKKEFGKLKDFKNIGLITSIQFVKAIPVVKRFLEKNGKRVLVHKALQYPGQVLGCQLEAAKAIEGKVDCFLCISAGKFYGLGVVLQTEKPVLCLDLERKEIYSLGGLKGKIQRITAWNKAQLDEAKKVGILVSWKKGQLKLPFGLKKKLEKKGKEVYILAMDEITPEKLEGLKLDFLVNCSCPRVGLDDLTRYNIPMLNYSGLKESE